MENPLRTRINERFEATGKTKDDAAKYLGKGRTYLYDFLSGKSGSINFDLIPKLAEFLGCDPRYLTGEAALPDGRGYTELRVTDVIGSFAHAITGEVRDLIVTSDIRYPAGSQQAWLVAGDDWQSMRIRDGSIIITSTAPTPREGDLVAFVGENGTVELGEIRSGSIARADGTTAPEGTKSLGAVIVEMTVFGQSNV